MQMREPQPLSAQTKNFRNAGRNSAQWAAPMKQHALTLAAALLTLSSLSADVILAPGSTWEYQGTDPSLTDVSWMTSTANPLASSGPAPFGNTVGGDFGANSPWADNTDLFVRRTF